MATARLIDSQKQELVRRFRQGESSQALADHFGCSVTTITRLVRAELSPEEYATLRDQRQRGKGGRDRQIALAIDDGPKAAVGEPDNFAEAPRDGEPSPVAGGPLRVVPLAGAPIPGASGPTNDGDVDRAGALNPSPTPGGERVPSIAEQDFAANPGNPHQQSATEQDVCHEEPPQSHAPARPVDHEEGEDDPEASGAVLAIDDADDFAEDGDSEDDLLISDDDGDSETDGNRLDDHQTFQPVAVLPIAVEDQEEMRPAPWPPDHLPSCAYLLVDKTVELQARPLAEIPELGRLPSEEQDQQALVLFTNPRQAKRLCGRTQRVIKLPDPALLGRTAPFLRAQGISRVVIEGMLYALPGGH